MNNLTLGQKIKELRLEKSLSIERLAKELSIHPTVISKIENDARKPSLKTFQSLAKYFELEDHEYNNYLRLLYLTNTNLNVENISREDSFNQGKEVENMDKQPVNIENQPANVNIPNGVSVQYSDSAFVTITQYGLVFDFAQLMGPTNTHTVVSRVGVSLEHAKAISKVLAKKIVELERLQQTKMEEVAEKSKN